MKSIFFTSMSSMLILSALCFLPGCVAEPEPHGEEALQQLNGAHPSDTAEFNDAQEDIHPEVEQSDESIEEIMLYEQRECASESATEAGGAKSDANAAAIADDETDNVSACYETSGSSFGGAQFVCDVLWGKLKAHCGLSGWAYGSCSCSCNSWTSWCSCDADMCCR